MNLSSFLISEDSTIFDAASVINDNNHQTAFVCNGSQLVAALSDGDIRRHILKRGDFSVPVKNVANYNPVYFYVNQRADAYLYAKEHGLRAIPIVNANKEIISIVFSDQMNVHKHTELTVPLVIMAGGKGTRLAPYTNILPKPLIPVGEKTITEHITDRFSEYGCKDFLMIINHKKELIKAYFNETEINGKIRFYDEPEFMGTGGGLSLVKNDINSTFFMTNCDILVDADYEDIFNYHKSNGNMITLVCAMKKVSVPYGTVDLNQDGRPVKLVEKPEYPLLTNTGLYVFEPEFFEFVPNEEFIHITDLIQKAIDAGDNVGVYPISENGWMDMGQFNELKNMYDKLI